MSHNNVSHTRVNHVTHFSDRHSYWYCVASNAVKNLFYGSFLRVACCVTRLIRVCVILCAITRLYVGQMFCILCDITRLCVWHYSCVMTYWCVWHIVWHYSFLRWTYVWHIMWHYSFVRVAFYVTWLIDVCDILCDITHLCVTLLIHVWHYSFKCATYVCTHAAVHTYTHTHLHTHTHKHIHTHTLSLSLSLCLTHTHTHTHTHEHRGGSAAW